MTPDQFAQVIDCLRAGLLLLGFIAVLQLPQIFR